MRTIVRALMQWVEDTVTGSNLRYSHEVWCGIRLWTDKERGE